MEYTNMEICKGSGAVYTISDSVQCTLHPNGI